MQNSEPIAAKATSVEEQSDGVVVSFGAEWHQPLIDGKFKAVIRKRVPKTLKPAWLYFHVNSPVSALCARAEIVAICQLTPAQARARAADLALAPAAVDAYTAGDSSIGCYELGKIMFARQNLNRDELNKRLVYHPPQSFFILSRAAKQIIDELAGFQTAHVRKTSKGR